MKTTNNVDYSGAVLPVKHGHIDTTGKEACIIYDIYVEHFALKISKKYLMRKHVILYPITCCPNCGHDLFKVWDTTNKS